ncbi:hypothetical protein ACP4OV_028133 [Aristida adscensionis]
MVEMASSGSTYLFALYSPELRSALGYDQRTLNTVSFFKDLGANVGVVSGLVNEVAPTWAMLLAGAAMNLAGYLMVYLVLTARVAAPPLWLMCLYFCVGANALNFANTGALVAAVESFPESRGFVIGLLKGFVGLSGAIYTQLYLAVYGGAGDASSLVLLIAWVPAAVCVFFARTIRAVPYGGDAGEVGAGGDSSSNDRPFYHLLYISVALAAYILAMIVVQKHVHFSHAMYVVSAAALLVVLLVLPLGVAIRAEHKSAAAAAASLLDQQPAMAVEPPTANTEAADDKTSPPPSPAVRGRAGGVGIGCIAGKLKPPASPGDDYSIAQALVSVEMLALFAAAACGLGGALTATDNMAQIGEALGYPAASTKAFVSLISVWRFAGRVGAGYLSELLLARRRLPRPLALTAVLLVSVAGHLLVAAGVPRSLGAASVILGFGMGAQWSLLYAVVSEVFGLRHFSTLFNVGSVSSPVGAYVLNVLVAGRMYDGEAARQRRGGGGGGGEAGGKVVCVGVACFRRAFLVIAAVTFAGAMASLVLVWKTWGFYKGDIYARFKVTGGTAMADDDGEGDGGRCAREGAAQEQIRAAL